MKLCSFIFTTSLSVIISLSAQAESSLATDKTDILFDNANDILSSSRCRKMFNNYLLLSKYKSFSYTVDPGGNYDTCWWKRAKTQDAAVAGALAGCNTSREKQRYVKKFSPECRTLATAHEIQLVPADFDLPTKLLAFPLAAGLKSLATVKALVGQGADVNTLGEYQVSPLIEASRENRIEVVKYLISQGADINYSTSNGLSALSVATMRDHLELFTLLLANNADINVETGRPGDKPMHYAAMIGNVDMLKLLLAKSENVNVPNKHTFTPLHKAAGLGQFDAVKFLVENGADVNARSRRGKTPLSEAKARDRAVIIEYLLKNGAIEPS